MDVTQLVQEQRWLERRVRMHEDRSAERKARDVWLSEHPTAYS